MCSKDEITLVLQGKPLLCSRNDLINNSDYFRAMFEGNFAEKDQTSVKLNDVDFESMEIILKLLWMKDTDSYCNELHNEDCAFSVFRVANMLQFLEVRQQLIQFFIQNLSPKNCIKIWLSSKQHDTVENIEKKAKLLALMEFNTIQRHYKSQFNQLDLSSLQEYIGNKHLQCHHELDALTTVLNWFESNESTSGEEIFIRLLHLVNFRKIPVEEIALSTSKPIVIKYKKIKKLLEIVGTLRDNQDVARYEEVDLDLARALLNGQDRNFLGYACVVVETIRIKSDSNQSVQSSVVFLDKFKRKRKYQNIENTNERPVFLYFDFNCKEFRKLFSVDNEISTNCLGFEIFGYKQYIYVVGGEYSLGYGRWNKAVSRYDTIQGTWKEMSVIQHPRRHFQACICGSHLFIIGGIGLFRIVQHNMIWCDLDTDEWKDMVDLPCPSLEIRCCSHDGQLFLWSLNNKTGYLFSKTDKKWVTYRFDTNGHTTTFSSCWNMSIFSYKSNIYFYIEERVLYELQFQRDTLLLTRESNLVSEHHDNFDDVWHGWYQCNLFISGDFLYTCAKEDDGYILYQVINLIDFEVIYRLEKLSPTIQLDDDSFKIKSNLAIIGAFYPDMNYDNVIE